MIKSLNDNFMIERFNHNFINDWIVKKLIKNGLLKNW